MLLALKSPSKQAYSGLLRPALDPSLQPTRDQRNHKNQRTAINHTSRPGVRDHPFFFFATPHVVIASVSVASPATHTSLLQASTPPQRPHSSMLDLSLSCCARRSKLRASMSRCSLLVASRSSDDVLVAAASAPCAFCASGGVDGDEGGTA